MLQKDGKKNQLLASSISIPESQQSESPNSTWNPMSKIEVFVNSPLVALVLSRGENCKVEIQKTLFDFALRILSPDPGG